MAFSAGKRLTTCRSNHRVSEYRPSLRRAIQKNRELLNGPPASHPPRGEQRLPDLVRGKRELLPEALEHHDVQTPLRWACDRANEGSVRANTGASRGGVDDRAHQRIGN